MKINLMTTSSDRTYSFQLEEKEEKDGREDEG